MCAVNPRIFGYGTMFYVPGYGYAVAEDTGANDSSLVSIDLFMDTKEDCLYDGAQTQCNGDNLPPSIERETAWYCNTMGPAVHS